METRIVSFVEARSQSFDNPVDFGSSVQDDSEFDEQEMPEVFGTSKRRSLPRPIRDSLATRERLRVGRPGSRRHNRYLNAVFLGASELDADLDNVEDLFWTPEFRSRFADLFEDEENMKAWLPFVDIDDDTQEVLLAIVCGEDSDDDAGSEEVLLSPEDERKVQAEMNFLAIDRHTRKLLKQAFNFGLIQSIEAELLTSFMDIDASFMRQESCQYFDLVPASPKKGRRSPKDQKSLGLAFKNSKDRKVCHGVCKYYSLQSYSEGAGESRVTTISTTEGYQYKDNPPPLLSEYLWENFFKD